ncbi:MAG: transposase [Candidatus Omnitrophota bacterium]
MSRIARIVYPAYPHHIVQRGNNKQPIFGDDQDKHFYFGLLKKYARQGGCKVHAYCLMTNHTHLLLVPNEKNSLAITMQKLSMSYTQHINRKYDRSGRLWEGRFFSALIDKESYLWTVCRYIEQNPLRARISEKATDYMWSSARINSGLIKSDFLEPIWETYLDKNEYQRLLAEGIEEAEIKKVRKSTSKGIPLGSQEFFDRMVGQFGKLIIPNPRGNPYRKRNGVCPELKN